MHGAPVESRAEGDERGEGGRAALSRSTGVAARGQAAVRLCAARTCTIPQAVLTLHMPHRGHTQLRQCRRVAIPHEPPNFVLRNQQTAMENA